MNLLDVVPADARSALSGWLSDRGEPPYRLQQVLPRLWRRPLGDWQDATDLPGTLIEALSAEWPLARPRLLTRQRSSDGTEKYLWGFDAHTAVETVAIPEGRRVTLCISSQAGCAYGCVFCATGAMGFQRHLAPWEITAQVREFVLAGRKPTNIVFMGMGEPLHNWNAVDTALTVLNDPLGFGIGARRITVSTIGIIPNLEKLVARPEQFRVALSLHSAIGERRAAIMPIERKYPLTDVLAVLERVARRVTFEYVMIRGINDAPDDAAELGRIAKPLGALVNLLPLHPGGAANLCGTAPADVDAFAAAVRGQGVSVTVRRSRGLDISAACGQLRVETKDAGGIAPQNHARVEQ